MLSLATVGFLSAGIFFIVYANTFYSITKKNFPPVLKNFAYAYYLLGAAFFQWSVAAFIPTQNMLVLSVLIGNFLLLLSSYFILTILVEKNTIKFAALSGWIIFSLAFVASRYIYFHPEPVLENGILIFNTHPIIAAVLSFVLIIVWMPTNLKVAKLITEKLQTNGMYFIYSSIYVMATIAAIIFMAARTPLGVTLSFTGLVICFVMLIASNVMIDKTLKK